MGYNSGAIIECRADASVFTEGKSAGGLVGESLEEGVITKSFSTGTLTLHNYGGGLVGSNQGEITACYSTCAVNGTDCLGGLTGDNSGPIHDSYAAGPVNGTGYDVCGLSCSSGELSTNCYWDTETSGQNSSSAGETGKSTADMKKQATFTGWDFTTVWGINSTDNSGYPFLRWQGFVHQDPVVNLCMIGTVEYATLDDALAAVTNGQTIKLLNNITHTTPITIDGKTVYLELGDYNLLLDVSAYTEVWFTYALTVVNGGKLRLSGTGTGQFNVKGPANGGGVNVLGRNSEATVDNIDAPGIDATGIHMYGSGSYLDGGKITVKGNVAARRTGIEVNARNANIVVNGNITAGNSGVLIWANPGTSVTVGSNIHILGNYQQTIQGMGVRANGGSVVTVGGGVTVQGANNIGVYAYGGTINVAGNVVSSGIGAKSNGNGTVTISGSLSSGTPFVVLGETEKTPEQITEPTTKSGFLTYTDGTSTIWINSVGERIYTVPSMPQDFTAAPGDGRAELSWSAPVSDGGRDILNYQVSKDNGATWEDAGLNTTYIFNELTNGTEYTFKVRACNSEGCGLEADTTAVPRANICRIGETGYATLNEALYAIYSGESKTITLLKNIDHYYGVSIDNKKVTFDLNGYTLNINNPAEYEAGLTVYDGGSVYLTGSGALNVTGKAYGVTTSSNSALCEVTVTNATASGMWGIAAHAYSEASLTVLGDVTATQLGGFGVHAQEGAVIDVLGNVSAGNQGVCVSGAAARVYGNVQANGYDINENPEGIGVSVYDGVAEIGGNVTANRVGAMIFAGGSITVDGTMTAPDYIQFADDPPTAIDGFLAVTTKPGYLTYQHETAGTVWVKAPAPTEIIAPKAGSGCVVDSGSGMIYGITPGISIEQFETGFVSVGSGYSLQYSPETIGTGTVVNVVNDSTGAVALTFQLVIYGDTNGDGLINTVDADICNLVQNWMIEWDETEDAAFLKAADVNGDGRIDTADADIINLHANWLVTIDQSTGLAS